MSAKNAIQSGLTRVGPHLPRRAPAWFSGVANFLATGQLLADLGMQIPLRVAHRDELFSQALPYMGGAAVYCEFGVYAGDSMRWWSHSLTEPASRLYGFDSFQGLPAGWTEGAGLGHFDTGGQPPAISDARIQWVKGLFDATIPGFSIGDRSRLFVNVDCDIYASTVTVLDWAEKNVQIGDFVYFDEFHERGHEQLAFLEFVRRTGWRFDVVGAARALNFLLLRRTI